MKSRGWGVRDVQRHLSGMSRKIAIVGDGGRAPPRRALGQSRGVGARCPRGHDLACIIRGVRAALPRLSASGKSGCRVCIATDGSEPLRHAVTPPGLRQDLRR